MLTCIQNNTSITEIIKKVLTSTLAKLDILQNTTLNHLSKIIIENIYHFDQDTNLTKITLSMLPLPNTEEINKIFRTSNNKYKPSTILVYKITKKIYKEIWIPRCQQIQTLTTPNHTNSTTVTETLINNTIISQNTRDIYQIAKDKQVPKNQIPIGI